MNNNNQQESLRQIFIKVEGKTHISNAAVRMADLDSLGVVHSNVYLIFFEDGFLSFMNWVEASCSSLDERGIGFPVVSASLDYRSPTYFEDVLEIHTSISNLGNSSFTCYHKVYRISDAQRILSAEGKMIRVVADVKNIKTMNLSDVHVPRSSC